MTYQVPVAKSSLNQNRFSFTVPGSKTKHSLPLVQYLDRGLKDELLDSVKGLSVGAVNEAQAQVVWEIQLTIFRKYIPDLVQELEDDQLADLGKAWMEASTISLGESSASSGS